MTELFTINGIRFFEHPIHGDESGIVIKAGGRFFVTDCYDMPNQDEAQDIKNCALNGYYTEIDSLGVAKC